MTLKQQIDRDIKTAMLAGEKTLVTTLRGLKSVILYAEVAKGSRSEGLSDAEIIDLLAKEAKKRQESADLYRQGHNEEKAQAELVEKKVIEHYLPEQLSVADIQSLIDKKIGVKGTISADQIGKLIGEIKTQTSGAADGSVIAQLVKARVKP